MVLSIAGDSIQFKYAYYLRFYEMWLVRKLNKPLVLYAQSIGPFNGIQVFLAKKYLSLETLILVRDQKTIDLLVKYGVSTKIKRTADSAISLPPKNSPIVENLSSNLLPDQNIGIVMRTSLYSGISDVNYKAYLGEMKKLIDFLIIKKYKIIFLASIREDAQAARNFLKMYNLEEELIDLRRFLSSEVPRMHPIILATTVGVPAIGIANEFKTKEYLRMMGLEDYCIKIEPFDSNKAIQAFCAIEDNYTSIKKSLIEKVSVANELSLNNARFVKELASQINS